LQRSVSLTLIPLPEQGRTTMRNWLHKIGMGLGVAATFAGAATMLLNHPADCAAQLGAAVCQVAVPLVALVPANAAAVVTTVGAVVAAANGLFHTAPGAVTPADKPAAVA
jgi:hypothetical protein